MNANQNRDDFQQLWERRKQTWQNENDMNVPDDTTVLKMAELARQHTELSESPTISLVMRRRHRWIPYVAAASLIIGIVTYGLNRKVKPDNLLPVAEEVSIGGQTFHFLCNKGCSANEVLIAANEVIKE